MSGYRNLVGVEVRDPDGVRCSMSGHQTRRGPADLDRQHTVPHPHLLHLTVGPAGKGSSLHRHPTKFLVDLLSATEHDKLVKTGHWITP